MANYILNTTNIAAWNVDAWNLQAVITADGAVAQPNGRLVKLANIDNTNGTLNSYRYEVALAGAEETEPLYIIDTPEVDVYKEYAFGANPDDILNFVNPVGKTMSIRKLMQGDVIEVGNSTDYFAQAVTATDIGTGVKTISGGKFEVDVNGTAFVVEALNTIRVGATSVPTVLLRVL